MSFNPVHEAHAIDKASFVMTFGEQLKPSAWIALMARAIEVGRERELTHPIEGLAAQFSVQHGVPDVQPSVTLNVMSAGMGFRQASDNGQPLFEFAVQRNEIRIDVHAYVRWAGFRALVLDLIPALQSSLSEAVSIAQIKVEYWDRFVSDDPMSAWSDVVKTDAGPLAWIAGRTSNWHSHMGWFDETGDDLVLVNMDIDALTEGGEPNNLAKAIRLHTFTGYVGPLGSVADVCSTLGDRIDRLHQVSKRTVGEVLSPDMVARISLFPEGNG